jgi:hypothetical protein
MDQCQIMYLSRLASDEINMSSEESQNEYALFLESYVNSQETLVEVIKNLKCKMSVENLEDFFEPLSDYVKMYKPKQSTILKTSHVFCDDCCDLYIPSFLCVWVRNNPELFDTEIHFFNRLFEYFDTQIKPDVTTYPEDDFYSGDDTPISGQSNREKLKVLASVVKHHDYIIKYLLS